MRADGAAAYAVVAQVMARLQSAGFTSINLITDTGTPEPPPAAAANLRPSAEATP